MTFLTDFDIRFSEESDLSFLERCFSEEGACDEFPFNEEEKGLALKNWIGFSKFKASLTGVWKGGEPCAVGTLFLMPYRKVAHHASFYLIVAPEARRKGIGTSLVKNLLHLGKTRFRLESVHVELYEPSHLLPILEKFHFTPFARQENFVHQNGVQRARILLEYFF
ncbi:MAG: GNAT family N-acetyltransferase [Chlamydiia bacterium]|nr:GNAT family N-acetyltransferase [Chlamydiia bacterium]